MRWFVMLMWVALSGCSIFMKSMEKPSAEVRGVSVASAGFTGVQGELRLDVSNPNPIGVPLQSIESQLSIGGTEAVTGAVKLSQTIPARGVAPVVTSLAIDARDAIDVGSALARGSRDYQLRATLTFATKIGPISVDVEHRGQLGGGGGLVDRVLGANREFLGGEVQLHDPAERVRYASPLTNARSGRYDEQLRDPGAVS
jgi:LEA14-like dessication related protein